MENGVGKDTFRKAAELTLGGSIIETAGTSSTGRPG